ncbi:MAG: proline dehydrogenase family protein [bacterium JZ-2024 1]
MAVLKAVLFGLSRNRRVERFAKQFGPARALTRRFVAGDTLADFLRVAELLTRHGFRVIADHLGESVTDIASATRATDEYIQAIYALGERRIPGPYISLKLTQLGLDLGTEVARANLWRLLESARHHGVFTRIDMEASPYVERTLQIYRESVGKFPALGVVLQSMLKRSRADAETLIAVGANVRLVKGAYLEHPDIAFRSKKEVNAEFDAIAERFVRPDALSRGVFIAIATHDPARIQKFLALVHDRQVPQSHYEFQMLYGVRTDLQEHLKSSGQPVRVYVPYGSEWYPYLMRRMAERPANLWFVVKNILRI